MTILQTSQSYSDYIFKRKIFRNGEIENFLTMSRCYQMHEVEWLSCADHKCVQPGV